MVRAPQDASWAAGWPASTRAGACAKLPTVLGVVFFQVACLAAWGRTTLAPLCELHGPRWQELLHLDEQRKDQLEELESKFQEQFESMGHSTASDPALAEKLEQQSGEIERLGVQIAALQSALVAAAREADRRVAEAEASVEQMLLTATRGHSERRELQQQVDRLKQQAADRSEQAAAAAMATHMMMGGGGGAAAAAGRAVDEDLLEELEDKVETLQQEIVSLSEQNAQLKKTPAFPTKQPPGHSQPASPLREQQGHSQPATCHPSSRSSSGSRSGSNTAVARAVWLCTVSFSQHRTGAPRTLAERRRAPPTHPPTHPPARPPAHPRCVEQSSEVGRELGEGLERLRSSASCVGLEHCFAQHAVRGWVGVCPPCLGPCPPSHHAPAQTQATHCTREAWRGLDPHTQLAEVALALSALAHTRAQETEALQLRCATLRRHRVVADPVCVRNGVAPQLTHVPCCTAGRRRGHSPHRPTPGQGHASLRMCSRAQAVMPTDVPRVQPLPHSALEGRAVSRAGGGGSTREPNRAVSATRAPRRLDASPDTRGRAMLPRVPPTVRPTASQVCRAGGGVREQRRPCAAQGQALGAPHPGGLRGRLSRRQVPVADVWPANHALGHLVYGRTHTCACRDRCARPKTPVRPHAMTDEPLHGGVFACACDDGPPARQDLLAPTVVHGQVQRLVSEREDSQSQNDSLRVRLKESQRAAADSLKQGEAAAGLRNHNRQLQQSLSKLEAHLGPGSAGLADTIAALELQVAALQAAAPGTAPARPGLAGVRSSLFENSLFEDGDAAAAGDGGQALESRELQRQLAAEQGRTAALTRQQPSLHGAPDEGNTQSEAPVVAFLTPPDPRQATSAQPRALGALQALLSTAPASQAAPKAPAPLPSSTPTGNPFASGNLDDGPPAWDPPSAPQQQPADRAGLEAQIALLTADRLALTAQVAHLTGELEMQVSLCLSEDAPAPRNQTPHPGSSGAPPPDTAQRVSAVASEAENAALRAMISELQAQILDFNDADSIIKEWSDYADTLTQEHATLTAQHGGLAAEQVALRNRHASLTLEHASLAEDLGLVSLERAALASRVEGLVQDVESLTRQAGSLKLEGASLGEERQRLSQLTEALQAQVAGRDAGLEADRERLGQLVSGLQQQGSHREAELAAAVQELAAAEERLGGLQLLLAESREEADTATGLARERGAKCDKLLAGCDAAAEGSERLELLLAKVTARAAAAEGTARTAAQDASAAAGARQELEAALAVAVALSDSRAAELLALSPAQLASPETTRSSSLPRPGDRRLAEQVASLSARKAELEAEVADLRQQLLAATTAAATLQQHSLPEEPSPTPSADQRPQQAITRRDTDDDGSALGGWDARVELLPRERSVLQATIEGLTAVNALTQGSGPAPGPLFGDDSGDLLGLGWSTPTEQGSPRASAQPSFSHGNGSGSTEREQSLQASLQQAVATNTELQVLVVSLQSELGQAPRVPSVSHAGATVTYRTSQGWGPGGPGGSSSAVEDAAAFFGLPPASLHPHATPPPQLHRTGATIMLPAAAHTPEAGSTGAAASLQQERTILAATVTGLRSEVERLQGEVQELRETAAEHEAHAENVEHSSWQLQQELGRSQQELGGCQQELAGAQSQLLALQQLLQLAHAARGAAEAAAAVASPRAGPAPPSPGGEAHAGPGGGVARGVRGEQAAAEAVAAADDAAAPWVQLADLQSELELLKGGYAFALEIMRSALGHSKEDIEAGGMDFETALDLTTPESMLPIASTPVHDIAPAPLSPSSRPPPPPGSKLAQGRMEELQDCVSASRRTARDASAHASELQDLLEACELERQALEEQLAEAAQHDSSSRARDAACDGYPNARYSQSGLGNGVSPGPGRAGQGAAGLMSSGSVGFSYGNESSLTLSALEQQLALSETARAAAEAQLGAGVVQARALGAEAAAATAEGGGGWRRRWASCAAAHACQQYPQPCDMATAQQTCQAEGHTWHSPGRSLTAALTAETHSLVVIAAGAADSRPLSRQRSGNGRPGSRNTTVDSEDDSDADVASIRGKAAAKRALTLAQRSVTELTAVKLDLEGAIDEWEVRCTQQSRDIASLEQQLSQAGAQLAAAVAAAAAAAASVSASAAGRSGSGSMREQRQMEESSPAISSRDLSLIKRKMAELESQCARLALENTSLAHQLAEEVALREQLEEQVGGAVGPCCRGLVRHEFRAAGSHARLAHEWPSQSPHGPRGVCAASAGVCACATMSTPSLDVCALPSPTTHACTQLLKRLEDFGDDEAQDIVGAFETKYSKIRDRYKALQESNGEYVDELQEQIDALQVAADQMQAQLKSAESRADDGGGSRRGTRASSSAAAPSLTLNGHAVSQADLEELVRENDAFVAQLVANKMELALASEAEVQIKRDLYKAKDVNMKLAAKLTSAGSAGVHQRQQEEVNPPSRFKHARSGMCDGLMLQPQAQAALVTRAEGVRRWSSG
ncbi:MAG: hypothetical protein WDW38_007570 [Sanguina aurantia]